MIHYISAFANAWNNERNVADALAWHGHEVVRYLFSNPRDRPGHHGRPPLRPGDLVFTSVPHLLTLSELHWYRAAGAKLGCWYFDWLWGLAGRDAAYTPRLRLMDVVFSTDGLDDAEYVRRGVTCRHWLPQAAMPEDRLLEPTKGTPRHDVAFMGHVYSQDRSEMARRLSARWDFAVYGDSSGHRVWGREMTSICQRSKIMIGTNYRNDIPGYWSDRCYVVMGAGGFYLGQRVPGLERYFEDGVHLGTFDGFDDMERQVAFWLTHDYDRECCRKRGHALVHEFHTYTHRVGELIDTMRQLGIVQ